MVHRDFWGSPEKVRKALCQILARVLRAEEGSENECLCREGRRSSSILL